jgi:hypothetical protein
MEKDIGKIKKNDNTDIVVRIDDFGGSVGLTIREFVTGDRYTGFTKKGTRIPADSVGEFKKMISSIKDEDLVLEDKSENQESKEDKAGQEKSEEKDKESGEEIEEVTL